MEKEIKKDGKIEYAQNLLKSIIRDEEKIEKKRNELRQLNYPVQPLRIADHAKLRYLERVLGMDVDALCQPLLTEQLLRVAQVLGNGTFPIGEGNIMAVVHNGIVATVINF